MQEKLVRLKSEKVEGLNVQFFKRYVKNKNNEWKKVHIVAVIKELQRNDRRFFSGGETKEQLLRRLSMEIRNVKQAREDDIRVNKFKNRKPQRFYFKLRTTSTSIYGGRNQTAEIFEHKPSGLQKVGQVKWNTASYKGDTSEVLSFLQRTGRVPKEMFPRGYYSWSEAKAMNFKIEQI